MAGMTPSRTWSRTKSGVARIFFASSSVVINPSSTNYYVASSTVRAVNREGIISDCWNLKSICWHRSKQGRATTFNGALPPTSNGR
jgi:hypothetical protein